MSNADKSLKNKDIEDHSNKNFFSKRNTLFIVIAFILSIALVVLTIIYVLKIQWTNLFNQINSGFIGWGWLCFLLLAAFVFWNFFCRGIIITIKLGKIGYQVSFWNKLMYATTICFLSAVSPANLVTDPYTVFWLKTNGVSTSKASAITVYNSLIWETVQLIITLPSFIWILVNLNVFFNQNNGDQTGKIWVFICMIVGILLNFFGLTAMLIVGFSRKLHYFLSRVFNRTKKILHLSYHTKAQTYQTYVTEAKLQKEFLAILKLWKTTIISLLVVAFNEVYVYFTIIFALQFLAGGLAYHVDLNWWKIFNVVNVTTTANRFIPLPGSELSIQWILREFMYSDIGGITPLNKDTDTLINNSIMVWRSFNNYFPALIGLFGFGSLTFTQIKQYRLKHKK